MLNYSLNVYTITILKKKKLGRGGAMAPLCPLLVPSLFKGKSTFFYYCYHVCLAWLIRSSSACHGHMNEVPGKRGIIYAQARPKWVTVGPVSTPLLRTLGSSTAEDSPTQHCKKAHHNCYNPFLLSYLNQKKGERFLKNIPMFAHLN